MPYTAPTGNAVDFTQTGVAYSRPVGHVVNFNSGYLFPFGDAADLKFGSGYTAPLGGAADLAFSPSGNRFSIAGASTAAFNTEVATAVHGVSTASFSGAVSGYQASTATIGGVSTVGYHVVAYIDAPFSAAGSTALTQYAQVFGTSAYALFGFGANSAWVSESFSGGMCAVLGQASAAFTPIYSMSCSAGASTDLKIGGMVTHPFTAAGAAGSALLGTRLRAGFMQSFGSTSYVFNARRIAAAGLSASGAAAAAYYPNTLQTGAYSVGGTGTTSVGIGAVTPATSSIAGAAGGELYSASFGDVTAAVLGAGAVDFRIGGMVTHPFTAAGAGTVSGGVETLLQGLLLDVPGVATAGFGSGYRVQAIRYDTCYVPPMVDPVAYAFTPSDEVEVLTVADEVAVATFIADLIAFTYQEELHILPEHVRAIEAVT